MGLATTQLEPGVTDAEIIARICSGDEGAMSLLYDLYSRMVYAVAFRLMSDTSAAEDILQDVFMQLWRNPQAFKASRGSVAAWLAVIARNRAIDQLRKKRPEAEAAETGPVDDQLRGRVREAGPLPDLDLLAHRLEVALHTVHSDREDVYEAQAFGVLGKHGCEATLERNHLSTAREDRGAASPSPE